MKDLTLIAAMDRNYLIGDGERIPWHLPEDFKHFKNYTMGKTMIMGRKTFESIGRPLPGRTTIVVTRQDDWSFDGVETAKSLDEAVEMASGEEVIIAGGGEIYTHALPSASKLVLSVVEGSFTGDVYFPKLDKMEWYSVGYEMHDGFAVITYKRRRDEQLG